MHPATDEERKALVIPPAWTNVWMSNDAEAPLQAVGLDSKGRKQYRYSAAHSEQHAAAKFSRVRDFDVELPALQQKIERDLSKREEAAVLYLVNLTGFRIGSDQETGGNVKAYGASTLLPEHVKVEGDTVKFSFVGKKGVRIQKTVTDSKLAGVIKPRLKGKRPLFGVSDSEVRGYLHAIDGEFTVKDFRTWHGTSRALQAMRNMPAPKSAKELKKAKVRVGDLVAGHLGNTRTIALSSYIDPAVFSRWEEAVALAGQ
jgi:DNA topoisomerase-1